MIRPGPPRYALAIFKAAVVAALMTLGLVGCVSRLEPVALAPLPTPATAVPHPTPGITVPHPAPEPVKPMLPAIAFTIQVGAFSTPDRAARYMATLQANSLDAYYFIDTDGLCKVRFERFDTREAAHERAMALQTLGIIQDYFIARPGPGIATAQGPVIDPQSALGQNLIDTARRFIGTPYQWGGSSLRDGFDCSGLTMTVYRLNGLDLPRNSRAQFHAGTPVARDALRGGDLVFFSTNGGKYVSHVGIYSGRGRFIHAPGRGKRIRTASLSNTYFRARYKGARRYY